MSTASALEHVLERFQPETDEDREAVAELQEYLPELQEQEADEDE